MMLLIGFILGFISAIIIVSMIVKKKSKDGEYASAYFDESTMTWIVRGQLKTIAAIVDRIETGNFAGNVDRKY